MPRSFLVKKKKTKCKDESTSSCDAGGQIVVGLEVDAEGTSSVDREETGTTPVAGLQNNAGNIAHGDQRQELQKPPSVQLLPFSGQYTAAYTAGLCNVD